MRFVTGTARVMLVNVVPARTGMVAVVIMPGMGLRAANVTVSVVGMALMVVPRMVVPRMPPQQRCRLRLQGHETAQRLARPRRTEGFQPFTECKQQHYGGCLAPFTNQ